jgi:hypothetical protein
MGVIKKTETFTREYISHGECDRCGNRLECVYPETASFCRAGKITFKGGYGEYIDGESELLLCHFCLDIMRNHSNIIDYLCIKAEK